MKKNFQLSIFNFQKQQGFTLVETLVAISILVLSVSGSFTAVQSGIFNTNLSKEGIVAYYLAQEGIEQVRNIRDVNGLKGVYWLTNIIGPGPCYFGGRACMVDALNADLIECPGDVDSCPAVKIDLENGYYGHNSGWTATQYTRGITFESIGPDEVSILVTVKWQKGMVTREFKVKENIYNWQ